MREEEEYRDGEGRAQGPLGQQKSGSLSQTQIPQSFGSLSGSLGQFRLLGQPEGS